jgi:hypothetical protein
MSIALYNSRNIHVLLNDPNELVDQHQLLQVSGANLKNDYSAHIKDVCIFQGPSSSVAVESVKSFNLNPILLESFNILDRNSISVDDYNNLQIKEIVLPEQYKNVEWVNQVRLTNHKIKHNEVCRILNHMMAWHYSMKENRPIIVMEHDTILNAQHNFHVPRNSINALATNTYNMHNENYICMDKPYAYSVDQFSSKRLFNLIMEQGIREPMEFMIRIDQFNVINHFKVLRIKNNF